jgi:colicin import membrane protein
MASAELAVIEHTESALAVVESMTPEKLFSPGTMDPLLEQIKAEVRATYTDISTDKGRKAIASLAYKVSRTKTFIDGQRISLVAEEKERLARIDAEGKRVREELDALRDEVRQPLTDWENKEKGRIAAHGDALIEITKAAYFEAPEPSLCEIDARLERVEKLFSRDWQEFSKRASEAADAACRSLTTLRAATVKREEERAELERLRREAEERAQREREEAIAKAARDKAEQEAREREEAAARAAEQERQRLADEAREREEAAARAAEQERQRIEAEAREREAAILREKEAAEERARQAEAERIAAEEKAAREAKAASERAEEERIAAEQRAEDERLAAESRVRKAEADRQAAIEQAERDRIAAQEKAERDAAEAKRAHEAELTRIEQQRIDDEQAALERTRQAEAKAKADQEAAVEAERQRVAVENKRIADEEKAREKDQARRADVHSVALNQFVNFGLDQEAAKQAVIAIAKGKIPNVKFSY